MILSVYFGFHDSCITFADGERILLHLEAERVYKQKHLRIKDPEHMCEFIRIGLEYLGASINDVETLLIAKWNNQFDAQPTILGKKFTAPIMTGHHENHIGTANPSGLLDDAVVIVADGGSEDGTTRIYHKSGENLTCLADLNDTVMNGRFYGTVTQMLLDPNFIGAHAHSPGKTMGLAALGQYSDPLNTLFRQHEQQLNKLYKKGVNGLRQKFGLVNGYDDVWKHQGNLDFAFMAQTYWQRAFMQKIRELASVSSNLVLTGGCFLNILLNTEIVESGLFNNVYVSPSSGDNAQSLGAILYHFSHIQCEYPFLGRGYGDIDGVPEQLVAQVVSDLMDHQIIAWYQGRSPIGARALGHRSFIGVPDSVDMRVLLSEDIKGREPFRPVAGIILADRLAEFFNVNHLTESEYMTYAPAAAPYTCEKAPAIVHTDGTCRIQTLERKQNPVLYEIIRRVGEQTGVPIIMNTSFNVMGDPIVDTPADAQETFEKSKTHVLYINGERTVHM